MAAGVPLRPDSSLQPGDDERSLLMRLEHLLEREEALLAAQDAAALTALADEREHVTARLVAVTRQYRGAGRDAADNLELITLYQRVRQRHDVHAGIVQRHVERNARATGVLAQATGRGDLYNADGRVAVRYAAL